jgi:hypothetical protein
MDQLWVAAISGGGVERGNLAPDREAAGHFGSPSGCAEPMASGRKCVEIPLKAGRNRWAWRGDLKRFIARSRCRVG